MVYIVILFFGIWVLWEGIPGSNWYFDTVVAVVIARWLDHRLSCPGSPGLHWPSVFQFLVLFISVYICVTLCSENTGGNNRSPGFTVWLLTNSCFLEFSLKEFLCYNKFLIFIINQWTWKKVNIWIWATFRICVKIVYIASCLMHVSILSWFAQMYQESLLFFSLLAYFALVKWTEIYILNKWSILSLFSVGFLLSRSQAMVSFNSFVVPQPFSGFTETSPIDS